MISATGGGRNSGGDQPSRGSGRSNSKPRPLAHPSMLPPRRQHLRRVGIGPCRRLLRLRPVDEGELPRKQRCAPGRLPLAGIGSGRGRGSAPELQERLLQRRHRRFLDAPPPEEAFMVQRVRLHPGPRKPPHQPVPVPEGLAVGIERRRIAVPGHRHVGQVPVRERMSAAPAIAPIIASRFPILVAAVLSRAEGSPSPEEDATGKTS